MRYDAARCGTLRHASVVQYDYGAAGAQMVRDAIQFGSNFMTGSPTKIGRIGVRTNKVTGYPRVSPGEVMRRSELA